MSDKEKLKACRDIVAKYLYDLSLEQEFKDWPVSYGIPYRCKYGELPKKDKKHWRKKADKLFRLIINSKEWVDLVEGDNDADPVGTMIDPITNERMDEEYKHTFRVPNFFDGFNSYTVDEKNGITMTLKCGGMNDYNKS